MFFLGHMGDVLKDVLFEDLFVDFYYRSVILFSLSPSHELTSVKVLCAIKICSASCVVDMMDKH